MHQAQISVPDIQTCGPMALHSLDVNLTEMRVGSVIAVTMLLADSDALHINLYIRLRSTAEQVGTPTLTNIWLALELLGALNSSLIQSL